VTVLQIIMWWSAKRKEETATKKVVTLMFEGYVYRMRFASKM